MRLQGKITQWDDEKGFGFISWHGDGSRVFVHIKAFARSSRRPALGDIVTYEIGEGKDAKTSAQKVRYTEMPKAQQQPVIKRRNSSFAVPFTVFFLCLLLVAAQLERISWLVVLVYFVASLFAFIAYARDKSSAQWGEWRTPEASLHLMGLLGGWPGGLAAQRLLRHKSRKQDFLWVFWAMALLNVAAVSYLAWTGESGTINRLIESVWQGALALVDHLLGDY